MIKTRETCFADGRREIVRLLSADDLVSWSDRDPLAYEKSIVWLEDIECLSYVREVQVRCAKSRRGPLLVNSGERVIGYSKLLPDAPRNPATTCYTRRLFYLKDSDSPPPFQPLPANAVDPKTVLPGVPGKALRTAND